MNPNTELAGEQAPALFCNIGFEVKVIAHIDKISDGQCWYPLFRWLVVVIGYSTTWRLMSNNGLEISLGTLKKLIGTDRISPINNKFYIVGMPRWLVPTCYSDSIVLWHMIY